MKYALFGCLVGSLLFAGTQDSDLNVNRRYIVDSVIVAGKGWRANVSEPVEKVSNGLRKDLLALVGQKLNPGVLDGLSARLKKELDAREVNHHILRADVPDHVRVEFEVKPAGTSLHANLTKGLYHSKQGWSGAGMVGFTARQNTFLAGVASDGDTLNERFTGFTARYENQKIVTDRLTFRFDFETYHQQWNQATLEALAQNPEWTSGPYRTRQTFAPVLTIALSKPLTLEVGAAVERLGAAFAGLPDESSNAVFATLRYHQKVSDSEFPREFFADYTLRSASRALASDYVFASHVAGLHYRVAHGKHKLSDTMAIGAITGRAPLSDRFVAGNGTYLRGWNKFDIDPVGGNRLAHNTVDYRYGPFQAFYDVGTVWEGGQAATLRHSVGIGVRESVFALAVAFPVKTGHVEPVFMMGLFY